MTRVLITLSLLLLGAAPVVAQDMPLSQILIDGEGWKKVADPGDEPFRFTFNGFYTAHGPGTAFVVSAGAAYIDAVQVRADGAQVSQYAPYAPLRTKRGEKTIDVGGLATDRDGRIYAATDIGVQVFDPTGRLCGVLTPAAPGKPDHMRLQGDTLTLWIGGAKYARKLRTEGVK